MQRNSKLVARALALAIAAMLIGAAGAPAATVQVTDDTLVVTSGDSANHDLRFRLSEDGSYDEVIDNVDFTDLPAECTYITPGDDTSISCLARPNLQVHLGGGNDKISFFDNECFNAYAFNLGDGANTSNLNDNCGPTLPGTLTISSGSGPDTLNAGSQGPVTYNAGGGDDSVYGTHADDVMYGGEGNDRLFGREGNDRALGEGGSDSPNGGPGNDLVDGGAGDDSLERCTSCIGNAADTAGADSYVGGPGADKLWLDTHAAGMNISIDGQANDGSSGEGDNVGPDIETIVGSNAADTFSGSAAAERFEGGGGADTVRGAGGDDSLIGGGGDDQLFGEAGNDHVEGQNDTDTVDGGPGTDVLYGDIAGCSVFCIPDVDTLLARDGERDIVNCGGPGVAQVDQYDDVASCLTVDRQDVGGGGAPAAASFAASRRSVKVSRTGRFRYSFAAGAGLSGGALLRSTSRVRVSRRARVTIGRKTFQVPDAGKVTLRVRLSRRNHAILRANRTIRTRVKVTLTNSSGGSSVASGIVTLKR